MSLPAEAAQQLNQWLGPRWSARPLAGDASVRAYFRVTGEDGATREIQAIARIDTPEELVAFRHGGILPYVLRQLAKG